MNWEPNDFISYGKHCRNDSVAAQLENIRAAYCAERALLMAFHERTFFGSLLLLADPNKAGHTPSEPLQLAAAVTFALNEMPPTSSADDMKRFLHNALAKPALRNLASILPEDRRLALVFPQSPGEGAVQHTDGGVAAWIIVLLASPAIPVDGAATGRLSTLHCMVNASAPVVVHRDRMRLQRIERTLLDCEHNRPLLNASIVADISIESFLRPESTLEYIRAAVFLTDSLGGGVYGLNRHGVLAKVTSLGDPEDTGVIDPAILADVAKRNRPILANRNPEESISTLAVPIQQPVITAVQYSTLGVLYVQKWLRSSDDAYSFRDLVILRDIVMRLCLWRSRALFAFAFDLTSTSLERLNRAELSRHVSHLDSLVQDNIPEDVPADLFSSQKEIQDAISNLYRLTMTRSVTVRLLSVASFHLVRFCAHPVKELDSPHRVIPIRSTYSVNAWVARTGTPCYLPDLIPSDALEAFAGLDGVAHIRERGTRCEYCHPIFLRGRLVGTVNLESTVPHAYSDSLSLIASFAEQLALFLQRSRTVEEHKLDAMAAQSKLSIHELLKLGSELQRTTGPLSLLECQAAGKKVLDSIKQRDGGHADALSMTVRDIVRHVLSERHFDSHVQWERTSEMLDTELPAEEALAFRLAFSDIVHNAYASSIAWKGARVLPHWGTEAWVSLYADLRQLGGKCYLEIAIVNPILEPLSEDIARNLYKRPIEKPDRMHIGALIAGILMRNIGGDIYLRRNDDILSSVIECPITAPYL